MYYMSWIEQQDIYIYFIKNFIKLYFIVYQINKFLINNTVKPTMH